MYNLYCHYTKHRCINTYLLWYTSTIYRALIETGRLEHIGALSEKQRRQEKQLKKNDKEENKREKGMHGWSVSIVNFSLYSVGRRPHVRVSNM